MKKALSIVLAVVVLLTLAGCGKKPSEIQLSQFDLGVRYLSDGNYQEAIAAFEAAIQIDPKQKGAYLGLADVYIAMDDTENAIDSLLAALGELGNDPEIIGKLEALGVIVDGDYIKTRVEEADGRYVLYYSDENGNMVEESYTSDGVMEYYFVNELDESGMVRVASEYTPDGTLVGVSYIRADGTQEKGIHYDEDGYMITYPDEDGLGSKQEYYTNDGVLQYYAIMKFDENGNYVSGTSYNPDGSVRNDEY